jgi:3-oxoacyl-[acyl-carrier-protein] synthase III
MCSRIFLYALSIGDKFIRSGILSAAVLLLVRPCFPTHMFVDWSYRDTCVLFSVGAGRHASGSDHIEG